MKLRPNINNAVITSVDEIHVHIQCKVQGYAVWDTIGIREESMLRPLFSRGKVIPHLNETLFYKEYERG